MAKPQQVLELRRCTRSATVALVAALTAACGGGGGEAASAAGSPTTAPPASINVAEAYRALIRSPHSYSLTGATSTSVQLTATVSFTPSQQITVEGGATFDSSLVTKSVYNSQGALIASSTLTLLMDVGSTNWAYVFEAADGSCVVRTGGSALPTSAALGQSGAYISGPKYGGCNPTRLPRSLWVSTETLNQAWAYKTIGSIPFVCIDSALSGSVGTATESNCIEVADATGALGARLRVTIRDRNGVTTTLSN